TPAGAVSMVRPGDLRVDVSPDGQLTTVTVRHGEAEMNAGGSTFPIPAGNSVVINSASSGTYDMHGAPGYDGFDQWALARDQQQDNAVSAQYVSRDMTGYDDLDAYGTWQVVPAYGRVWRPRPVAPGEVYFPSYRVSQRYVRNVNITNVRVTNINVTNVNVTNVHYANRERAGGMTTVPRDIFANGRPVGHSVVSVSPRARDAAPVLGHGVAITPGRDAMRGRSASAG